jgi:hypothetical protein
MPDQPYGGKSNTPPSVPNFTAPTTPAPDPPLPPDDPLPNLDNLVDATGLLGYDACMEYDLDYGLRSSPKAGPPGTQQAYWRAHGGRGRKTISVVATSLGVNPVLPSPNTSSDNDVLMRCKLVCFTPGNTPDGTQIKGALLILTYEMQKMPVPGVDVFDMMANPYDVTPAGVNILNPTDFYQYLNPGSAVEGFSGGPIDF